VAVFFLPQIPVESPEEEEALEPEYLRAAESPQAEPEPLRRPVVAAAEVLPPELRAAGTRRPLSSGWPKQHRAPSKNTNAAVAGKLAVWVVLTFVSWFLPYPNYDGGPGTPLSDSLFISNEIL
jgi:hypothetical protein